MILILALLPLLVCINPSDLRPRTMRHQHLKTFTTTALISLSTFTLLTPTISIASSTDVSINDYLVSIDNQKKPIKELLGPKATLIVNVASQCALTPQYEELVDLYTKYASKGFQILAFPCNQFGNQEPAEVKQIRVDMFKRFGATFPILDKIDVNGAFEDPLYTKLKSFKDIGVSNIGRISWNFEKFLINSEGVPVRRYKPGVLPSSIEDDVEALITTGKVPERRKPSLNDY